MTPLPVSQARARLHGGGEIAFLDVREAGEFGEGHPLFAVPAPYSRLELLAGGLIPRTDAEVLLIDGGDGVAERAAAALGRMGYSEVSWVSGGMPAWQAAGFPVYKGVNVPSKTLGEMAEHLWHPATVSAEDLARWQESGRDLRFFDARPPAEYAKMRVPGSACLPNGELAYRLSAVGGAGGAPIVITCAGRTRGLVGAIGLRLAGYEGEVYALENGTQGWALSGRALDRGNDPGAYPAMDEIALEDTRARADALIARQEIATTDAAGAAAMLAEPGRTTYLFDVRSAPEAADDPIAAAVHAPGGQLVQATDQWVGVRRARILLACDTGLRGALAAFWLRQLGFTPIVVRIDEALRALPSRETPRPVTPGAPIIPAGGALRRRNSDNARFLDLRSAMAYRKGHASGAAWAIRPRIAQAVRNTARPVLLVGDSEAQAGLAVHDLRALGVKDISIVEGGHAALCAAGAAREASPNVPSDAEAIDYLFFVHDRHDGNLESSRRYLAWETGLIDQLDAAERAEFTLSPPR